MALSRPVPLEDLEVAEYAFKCELNFGISPSKNPQFTDIKRFLTTHLNGCGGIIYLYNQSGTAVDAKAIDKWKTNIDDVIIKFVPVHIFRTCIKIVDDGIPILMVVDKSSEPITMESNIYTRHTAGNFCVYDAKSLYTILTQASAESVNLCRYGPYKTECEFPLVETQNVEFKYWDIKCLSDYVTKLQEPNTTRCVMGMPNLPEGGDIFIGIREDKEKKNNIITGVNLMVEDEGHFKDLFQKFMEKDPTTNEKRIWCDEEGIPQEGKNWSVLFSPVANGKMLIHIHINHYPGGVFIKAPVTNTIQEDGSTKEVTFHDWKEMIMMTRPKFQILRPFSDHDSYDAHIPTKNTCASNALEPGTKHKDMQSEKAINLGLAHKDSLSWTENRLNWDHNVKRASLALRVNIEALAHKSSCLTPCNPITITPNELNIRCSQTHTSTNRVFDALKRHIGKRKGFTLVADKWVSALTPPDSLQLQKPRHHLVDLFTVCDDGSAILWAVVESSSTSDDEVTEHWQYLMSSGRITKLKILLSCPLPTQLKWLKIDCQLHILNSPDPMITADVYQSEIRCSKDIRTALATLMLSQPSYIQTCIGEQLTFHLTCTQMECILNSNTVRFNLIEGAPGSGKSFIGFYLCNKFGMERTVFLCSTKPYFYYVQYQNNCRPLLIKDGLDLLNAIGNGSFDNKTCIVVDDCQNMEIEEDTWRCLFDFVRASAILHLYLLIDSKWQNFKKGHQSIKSCFRKYCDDCNIAEHVRPMTTIHRNTRMICSFILATAEEDPASPINDITCSNDLTGDNVEIRKVSRLMTDDRGNGLIQVLNEVIDSSKTTSADSSVCQSTDVTVLVDTENAPADAAMIYGILDHHCHNWIIHNACVYPVKGIRVETVDRFIGLDSPVIICIPSQAVIRNVHKENRSFSNPRYRAFVASRALRRLVWLTEDTLDAKLVDDFRFNKVPYGEER